MADSDFASVVLLMHCDGTNGSTTFTDSGPLALTLTTEGSAAISTTLPKWGTGCYSNTDAGTQSYVSTDFLATFNMGSGDFTIEGWGKTSSPTSTKVLFCSDRGGLIAQEIYISGGALNADSYNGSGTTFGNCSGGTIPSNTWFHWAYTRSGTSLRLFLDGTQVGSTATSSLIYPNANTKVYIGSEAAGTFWIGTIDDVRVTKGVARYTSNFTAPTAAFEGAPSGTSISVATGSVTLSGVAPTLSVSDTGGGDSDYASVVLLMHCDGTDASTDFVDNGPNALTLTAVGDAAVSTSNKKYGTGSLAATSGCVTVSGDTFDLGSGNFTVEGWGYTTDRATGQVLFTGLLFGSNCGPVVQILGSSGGQIDGISATDGGSFDGEVTGGSVTNNTWFHWAYVRNGTTFKLYLNGTSVGTPATSSIVLGTPNIVSVGALDAFGSVGIHGNLDDVRVSKVARYTTNFTPPTAAFPDTSGGGGGGTDVSIEVDAGSTTLASVAPAQVVSNFDSDFASVSALLHFDGTNGGTTFTDSASPPHTWTPGSGVTTSTSQKKFGSASAAFDGGGQLTTPAASGFGFAAGDFTVEGWRYSNNSGSTTCLVDTRDGSTSGVGIYDSVSGDNQLNYANDTELLFTGNVAFTANVWNHWAVVRTGTTVLGFVNGTQVFSGTDARTMASSGPVVIGADYTEGARFIGNLDEIRITKGVARYTSGFTPSTIAFGIGAPTNANFAPDAGSITGGSSTPNSITPDPFFSNVILLLHCNGTNGSTTFVDSSPSPRTITAQGNAHIDTGNPKYGTGAMLNSTGRLTTPGTPFALGTSNFTVEGWAYAADFSNDMFLIEGDTSGSLRSLYIKNNAGNIFSADAVLSSGSPIGLSLADGGATPIPTNAWFHFAVSRSGNTWYIFLDGVLIASDTSSASLPTPATFSIGGALSNAAPWVGSIDDVRVTLGTARYTSSFTPPAGEFLGSGVVNTSFAPGAGGITITGLAPIRTVAEPPTYDSDFASVSLLLHYDGSNGGTTFTDSSSFTHTVTASGGVTTVSSPANYGSAVGDFTGGGQLHIAHSTDLSLVTGDFTVETWANISSTASAGILIFKTATTGFRPFEILHSGGHFEARGWTNTSGVAYDIVDPTDIVTDTWYHLALTRLGSTFTFWVNGTSIGTFPQSANLYTASDPVWISGTSTGAAKIVGYLDDTRITKGLARYTTDFTPPTKAFDGPAPDPNFTATPGVGSVAFAGVAPKIPPKPSAGSVTLAGRTPNVVDSTPGVLDPSFTSVTLLLHFNGTNGSTTFVDSSQNTYALSFRGDAAISTASPKFGSGALANTTGNVYVTTPDTNFVFGTDDFTVEGWAKTSDNSTPQALYSGTFFHSGVYINRGPLVAIAFDTAGQLYASNENDTNLPFGDITGGSISNDTWFHWAYVVSSGTATLYLDGVSVGSKNVAGLSAGTPDNVIIGGYNPTQYLLQGQIDEVRVTKGVARYTSDFVPSGVEFTGGVATTTFTPSPGAIITAGQGVVVSSLPTYRMGVGSFAVTGRSPTVAVSILTRNPGVARIISVTYPPTVVAQLSIFATPNVGGITVTGRAPILAGATATYTPGSREFTFTGHTPQVDVAGSPTAHPLRGGFNLTGRAPSFTVVNFSSKGFLPGTGHLGTFVGVAPSLLQVAFLSKTIATETVTATDEFTATLDTSSGAGTGGGAGSGGGGTGGGTGGVGGGGTEGGGTDPLLFVLPPFLQQGHQLKDDSLSAEVLLGLGDPRVRRLDVAAKVTATGSWQMNQAVYGAFTTWYEDLLQAGAGEFDVQVMNYGAGLRTVRAVFLEPWEATTDDGINYTVSAKLQIGTLAEIPPSMPSGLPAPYVVYFLDTFTAGGN